jgi:hypothetical protein
MNPFTAMAFANGSNMDPFTAMAIANGSNMDPFTAMVIANGFNSKKKNDSNNGEISMMDHIRLCAMTGETDINACITAGACHEAKRGIFGKKKDKNENPFFELMQMNALEAMCPGIFNEYRDTNNNPQPSSSFNPAMRAHAGQCAIETYQNFKRKFDPEILKMLGITDGMIMKEEHLIKLFKMMNMPKLAAELQESLDHRKHIMRSINVGGVKSAYVQLMAALIECIDTTTKKFFEKKYAKFCSMDDEYAKLIKQYREKNLSNDLDDATDPATITAETFDN